MSPRNQLDTRSKSKKRSAKQIDTNTSPKTSPPSQSDPSKIRNTTGAMSTPDTLQILAMLLQINAQNEGLKSQLDSQQIELRDNTAMLKQQIVESHNIFKTEMTQLVENLKSEFKSEIESIHTKFDESTAKIGEKIVVIDEKLVDFDTRMTHIEKDIERIAHLNQLKLIGIPFTDNENLVNVFTKLANVIGYDITNPSNIPSLARVITRNKTTNSMALSQTIIMKFAAIHMKDAFYSLYLRLLPNKKVSSKDLGFTVDKRIIVGENLSQLNHEIFVIASNMKRDKSLAQVFTANGIVNVRVQKGGRTYEIRNKQQLEVLTLTSANEKDSSNTTNISNVPQQSNVENASQQTNSSNASEANNNTTQTSSSTASVAIVTNIKRYKIQTKQRKMYHRFQQTTHRIKFK